MPVEKDVQGKKWWWCPKWYWPFAVCSGYRTVHKWCYSFSWVKRTAYAVAMYHEACENGTLYTWTEFGLGLGDQGTIVPVGEMCFDSPRSSSGRCDSSNTGLQASGLSPSAPLAIDFETNLSELGFNVVETGSFEFTAENGGLCKRGVWPWKRTAHHQMITVSVTTRFATIEWYIGGAFLKSVNGVVSLSTQCIWPFPLPKGKIQNNTIVQLKYEIITQPNKSTLKLFNNPADGSFLVPIEMVALDGGKPFSKVNTYRKFTGETCDFNPEQVKEMARCLQRFSDISTEKAKSRIPKPGEPVMVFPEEIWQFVTPDKREIAESLLMIIKNSFRDDLETYTQAVNQLENEVGFVGDISRFIKKDAVEDGSKVAGNQLVASFVIGLLGGVLIVGLASLIKSNRN